MAGQGTRRALLTNRDTRLSDRKANLFQDRASITNLPEISWVALPSLINLSSSRVNVRLGCAATISPHRLIVNNINNPFHCILRSLAQRTCALQHCIALTGQGIDTCPDLAMTCATLHYSWTRTPGRGGRVLVHARVYILHLFQLDLPAFEHTACVQSVITLLACRWLPDRR